MGSAQQNKALVRRFYDEVCNGRKLDVADELFSPDHRNYDPQHEAPNGPRGIKQTVGLYQQAYGDARWTVEELIATEDGNWVMARWTGTGTHSGELMGIAPTRRRVRVTGLTLFRIHGNRIAESWDNWDTLGMLQQLGVVPASIGSTSG
jgi:predicted ester cyclase